MHKPKAVNDKSDTGMANTNMKSAKYTAAARQWENNRFSSPFGCSRNGRKQNHKQYIQKTNPFDKPGNTSKKPEQHPPYPMTDIIHHLTTEDSVNAALEYIKDGVVGFDTEFMERSPSREERIIDDLCKRYGWNKKPMLIAWQVVDQQMNGGFSINWDAIALCLIQIARDDTVWVIHLSAIRAFPRELERIIKSADIIKVGVGFSQDVYHLWHDLRTNMLNMVDVGLMAKLCMAEKYALMPFGNLSLQNSAADILGYYISKDEQKSNWKGVLTVDQIKYAAIDASACIRLYNALGPALEKLEVTHQVRIPPNWYSMNGRYGDLMRKYPTVWGEELAWSVKDCYWYYANKFQGYVEVATVAKP
ncbi:ribonuclease H-like domain-containing protein [Mycena epipterygia]|nr:ribonuclease H-like domain-containing protein [Mycena epipterygia]